ncbi:hypothetical protein ACFL96_12590 [Thermoproteota archaeon]
MSIGSKIKTAFVTSLAALVLVASPAAANDEEDPKKSTSALHVGYGVGVYPDRVFHGGSGRFNFEKGKGFFLSGGLYVGYDPDNEETVIHPQLGCGLYFSKGNNGRIGFAAYPLGLAAVEEELAYTLSAGFIFELLFHNEMGIYAFPNAGLMFGSEKLLGDDNTGGYGALEAGLVAHF